MYKPDRLTLAFSAANFGPSAAKSRTLTVWYSLGGGSGSTAQFTFSSAGTYTYYCKIHGYANMHGAVTIAAAPTAPPTAGPTPTPSSGSASTPQGNGTTAPATGAGLGVPMLLLPLGLVLIALGLVGRRKR